MIPVVRGSFITSRRVRTYRGRHHLRTCSLERPMAPLPAGRARMRARRPRARGPFWREPCAGTNRNRHRPAAHGATPIPVLRPEVAIRVGGMATGDGAPGTGPLGSGGRKARAKVICRVDICRSERCWATSLISAGRLAKANTRISGGAPPLFPLPISFFVDVLPGDMLLEPRRESHENGFSSPAPSLNRRLCRQTMDPLYPPLYRRIPEGPRTRDSPMLASRVALGIARALSLAWAARRRRALYFGIRATGIDEAWIAAAVPKD